MYSNQSSRGLLSSIAAVGALTLLAGCASSTAISHDDFIEAAADAGYRCTATAPNDERVTTITTCRNADDKETLLVVFDSSDDVQGGDLMFYQDGDEIVYGDDWIVVGDDKSDVDVLATIVNG